METIVVVVENSGNPSHAAAVATGQEKVGRGMPKKGIRAPIQQGFHIADQRRNPAGILTVDTPRKLYEVPKVSSIRNRSHSH